MNYPNNIKKTTSNNIVPINYKNRGMNLESDINITNEYYIDTKRAFIYKKPTPIKLVKVDYKLAKITEAYFEKPSTTDYNGIYKGQYIDFEAKETTNKTSFPISNIHPHQINHIRNIYNEKGICFLIVRFTTLNETYILMSKDFLKFIDNNDRSSIPLSYFKEKGFIVKDGFIPRIDYLKVLEENGGL